MSSSSSTPTLPNTPSGSLNVESKELFTTKATSNSKKASDLLESARLSAGIPTWNPDEEAKLKQLLTARKKAVEFLAPGSSANHLWHPDSSDSSSDCGTGQPSAPLRSKTSKRLHEIEEHYNKSQPGSNLGPGAMLRASISSAKPELANPRSSTTLSDTRMFTLYQASRLCGSTGTLANASYLLTSLRARLNAKHSFESWMAILTLVQSKETSSELNGLVSCFAPTTTSTRASIQLSSGVSSEEDSSELSDAEEILGESHSLDCSEELSGSEEEYRYAKRIRQQAESAWYKSTPSSQDSGHWTQDSDSGW